jgi:hypothetical protein
VRWVNTSSLSLFFLEEGVNFGVDQNIKTQLEFVAENDFFQQTNAKRTI